MVFSEVFSLREIKKKLDNEDFPFSGKTELGSAGFDFQKPAFYAGTAIHSGSRIREDLQEVLLVDPNDRYREEDPGTDQFIRDFPIRIVALDSRFEYDVNRIEKRAIPLTPDMAWGLNVWKRSLTSLEVERSLVKYREFHGLLDLVADYLVGCFGRVYIFDLHSYCYRREQNLPWHEDKKPVINLGTEAVNGAVFRKDIDLLIQHLKQITVDKRNISVAENAVFKGGYLARRLSARHHLNLAVFAIEFKKIFMDEWSGRFYPALFEQLVGQFSIQTFKYLEHLAQERT